MIIPPQQKKKRKLRIPLPKMLRLLVLGVLGILVLYAASSAYAAYQAPETRKITTTALRYDNIGQFDYVATLKNTTLFGDKTTLRPGEGTFFKQLINHVNITFSYRFQSSSDANITGDYFVDAVIQTKLWTKTYPLIPRTSFSEQGRSAWFTVTFPLEYSYYDQILAKINEETGVTAQSPILLLRSTVSVFATTLEGAVSSYFTPTINVSLGQKTLEISEKLSFTQPGSITKTTTVNVSEVPERRMLWTTLSLGLLAGLCIAAVLTTSTTEPQTETNKALRKMKKKYEEWIVETTTYPESTGLRKIQIKSLEDLTKISEEIAKPVFLYASPVSENHRFYVLDEPMLYEYVFKPDETKTTTHPLSSIT